MRRFGGRWVFLRRRKLNRASAFLPLLLLAGGTLRAGMVPGNLGSGLDALVQSNVKFNSAIQEGTAGQITLYNGYATQKAANAATLDGANTSFFGSDDSQDTDSSDNFFGTSDAAPHAAAIAALVLEANGGSGKVTTPAQMKSVLQRSAFPHDLDPYYAKGQARTTDGGKVTIIFKGDDEDSTLTTSFANGTTGIRDPNSILVKYIGPGSLTSLVLNGKAANVTDGTNGLTTPASNQSTYFALSTPGVVFDTGDEPFTLGTSSAGLTTTTVTSSVSTDQFTLMLTFSADAFPGGSDLRFTIGRDEYEGATSPPTRAAR